MKHIILLAGLLIAGTANAQNYEWAFNVGGATNNDQGNSITIDTSGNIYVTGKFALTADFDPGPGIANLISNGNDDIFVAKYDSSGNYLWAFNIGGIEQDEGIKITIDPKSGDLYLTGVFRTTADFDPGVGIANLTSNGWEDAFVAKYDANGNYLWAFSIGGGADDYGYCITTDSTGSGAIYVTGWFYNLVDFDPGIGIANLTASPSAYSAFIASYDTAGNYQWAFNIEGAGNSYGRGIDIDPTGSGDVYVTGSFEGTNDFDPGPGIANLTPNVQRDIFVARYDTNGNYIWALNIGGTNIDGGYGIASDPLGSGDMYVTGRFRNTADFDPGAGVANLTSNGFDDVFVAKYDSSGNYKWAFGVGGTNSDYGVDIAVSPEANGYVYVTGTFWYTADFDPGPGIENLTVNFVEMFIAKYDTSGNYMWAINAAGKGTGFSNGCGIAIDPAGSGDVYATGHFKDTVDFDPSLNTSNLISVNLQDIYIAKYNCKTYNTNDTTLAICSGDSVLIYGNYETVTGTYYDYMTTVYGCDSVCSTTLNIDSIYNIIDIPVGICQGDSSLIYGNYETVVGTYYDSLTTVCGTDSVHSTVLTLNPAYNISDTPVDICNGDSALIYGNYETVAGTYYDSLFTVGFGCDSIYSTVLTINPTYDIVDAPVSVCDNDSIIIYGNYETVAGTYYDSLFTVGFGCDSIHLTVLTINPTHGIADTPVSVCDNDSIIIYGNYETVAGTYYDSLLTTKGCDSILTTVLTVNPVYNIIDNPVNICDGDVAVIYGNNETTAGTYYNNLTTVNGCDSIHSTVLTVDPVSASTDTVTITQGDSTLLGGGWQTTAGIYYDTLIATNGCDSVVATTLIVNVGIDEYGNSNSITIYPNPSEGKFTVSSGQLAVGNIQVFDVYGRVVLTTKEPQIDMSGFAKGMYYVKAGEAVRKLVLH